MPRALSVSLMRRCSGRSPTTGTILSPGNGVNTQADGCEAACVASFDEFDRVGLKDSQMGDGQESMHGKPRNCKTALDQSLTLPMRSFAASKNLMSSTLAMRGRFLVKPR